MFPNGTRPMPWPACSPQGFGPRGRQATLVAIGCFGLAVGVLVYVTDRAGAKGILLPIVDSLAGAQLFGVIGLWLPSFVHPFAFSLFTAAALPSRWAPRYGACIAWFAVNAAFEVGQHPLVRSHVATALDEGFGHAALVQPLANYFLRGTFDVIDIVGAALGAVAAAVVLRLMRPAQEDRHVS